MIEDKEYEVTLSIRVNTIVRFAPMERENPITKSDAIDNAIGSLPFGWLEAAESEGFSVAYPIDGEVVEV